MINPDVNEVMNDIQDAKAKLKPFLVKRAEVIRHMAGNHYRGDEKGPASPENYPFSYKSFVLPQLMFGEPRPTVKANSPIYAATANALQTAMDYWSKETGWDETLEEVISDCFAAFGVTKAGISPVGRSVRAVEGQEGVEADFNQVPNYPFVVRVDPRNFIVDADASRMSEARIVGETYEQDLEDVRADWRNDQAEVEKLSEVAREPETKSETSPFKNLTNRKATRKRVVLHEVWLREHGVLMTIGETGEASGVILRSEPYWGPPDGPYTLWGLDTVPGELIPISPLVALWDEYLEVTQHSKAMAKSASTYKKIVAYTPAGQDDAERIVNSENGETVCVKDLNSVKDMEVGGSSQFQGTFVEYVRNRFQNALGYGQAQQGIASSRTATGESIAQGNSDLRVDRMRGRIARSAKHAYRKPCWYFFHDNTIAQIESTYTDPQTGAQHPSTFVPGPWQGGFINNHWVPPELPSDFESYNLDVDAESMTKTDDALEQKRAQDLLTLSMQFIQMGVPVNERWVLDIYGVKALGIKELSRTFLLDQGQVIPLDPLAQGPQLLGPRPGAMPGRAQRPAGAGPAGTSGIGMGPGQAASGGFQRAPMAGPQQAAARRPAMAG